MNGEWQPPGGPGQSLTPALLAEYQERLEAHDVPIVRHLRRGLSEDEIRSVIAQIDLVAPDEAITWWSWHDAAQPGGEIAVGAQMLSLEAAAIETLQARDLAAEAISGGAGPEDWTEEYLWNPAWLKFLHTDGTGWALDTAPSGVSPVHYVDWWNDPERAHIALTPSLGDLVHRWIAAIDAGSMYFDQKHGWQVPMDIDLARRIWQVREIPGAPRIYQAGRW